MVGDLPNRCSGKKAVVLRASIRRPFRMFVHVLRRVLVAMSQPGSLEYCLTQPCPGWNESVELVVVANSPRSEDEKGDSGGSGHPKESASPPTPGRGY